MSFGRSKDETDKAIIPAPPSPTASTSTGKLEAHLGKNSKVIGKVTFQGPAELDGYVEGEVEAHDKLTIGESAVINAKVTGGDIIVKGQINGDLIASKRLALHRTAKVVGSISSANLSIEDGAILEGKCTMTPSSESDKMSLAKKGPEKLTA